MYDKGYSHRETVIIILFPNQTETSHLACPNKNLSKSEDDTYVIMYVAKTVSSPSTYIIYVGVRVTSRK